MRKLVFFGLVISLFAFGNKSEIKTTYAEEVEPAAAANSSVTFFAGNTKRLYNSDLKDYYQQIVSLKVSKDATDLPVSTVCEPIIISGCTGTDNLYAYISDSATHAGYYDCILYADVLEIFLNPQSAAYTFSYFPALEEVDISALNTSKATDMRYLFSSCSKLKKVDFSNNKFDALSNADSMFYGCTVLTSVNFTGVNATNVRFMGSMFNGCSSLTEVDLSDFKSSPLEVNSMFEKCSALKKVKMASLDLSNSRKTGYIFFNCNELEYLECPSALSASYPISLPSKLSNYYGFNSVTTSNLAQYPILNIVGDEFIKNWRALRTAGGSNGICAALVAGTEGNNKLNQLLVEYDGYDEDYKKYVDVAIDKDDVTIGDSVAYVKTHLSSTQSIVADNASKEDVGSFMNMTLTEDTPYLIVVIALLGVFAVLGYYFYNKKKRCNF